MVRAVCRDGEGATGVAVNGMCPAHGARRTAARREWRELEGDREGSWIEIGDCGGGSAASLGVAA